MWWTVQGVSRGLPWTTSVFKKLLDIFFGQLIFHTRPPACCIIDVHAAFTSTNVGMQTELGRQRRCCGSSDTLQVIQLQGHAILQAHWLGHACQWPCTRTASTITRSPSVGVHSCLYEIAQISQHLAFLGPLRAS